jgi:hypothetical protein
MKDSLPKKMIAFCGLDCAVCPAFRAGERFTLAERQKTADKWAKDFGAQIKAEDVDCVGCTMQTGRQIGHCAECEIRLCGLKKKVSTCAACPEYGCDKLSNFLKNVPSAKANLEELRA